LTQRPIALALKAIVLRPSFVKLSAETDGTISRREPPEIGRNPKGPRYSKTSVIAFLIHGLDGWEPNELEVEPPETVERLTHLSEGMVAKFRQNDDGISKIARDNGT
jgi:hypothetical protein